MVSRIYASKPDVGSCRLNFIFNLFICGGTFTRDIVRYAEGASNSHNIRAVEVSLTIVVILTRRTFAYILKLSGDKECCELCESRSITCTITRIGGALQFVANYVVGTSVLLEAF